MSALTIDEKLSLIQKMRTHANTNQMDTRTNVYQRTPGNGSQSPAMPGAEHIAAEDELAGQIPGIGGFRLRLFVCVLAFSAFLGLYKLNIQIKGHKVTEMTGFLEENQLPKNAQTSLETMAQQLVERFYAPE